MQFIDLTTLKLKAGKGGDGIVAFRREAHVPLGGPFGGDGGRGGDIIFEVDTHTSTLLDLRYHRIISAQNGENGKTKVMHGADGKDVIIKVPLGTIVRNLETKKIIADLTNKGQRAVIAKGGQGGKGNFHFKSPKNPAPDYAEKGAEGESLEVEVELKLLADAGLVGFPSVGKSTFLSVVSAAKPQIADYPFTTLVPNLGIVKVGDGRTFVLADLPGLIKGAALGKGLGHEFLRHIERCRVIIHVIDMSGETGRNPIDDYRIINDELESYKLKLMQRPQIVVANKMDADNAKENLEAFKKAYPDIEVYETTTLISEGVTQVIYKCADLLDITSPFPMEDEIEDVGVVYKYEPKPEPFYITKMGENLYKLTGEAIDKIFRRYDIEDEQEAMRFGLALKRLGVDQKLIENGAKEGDSIIINDYVFEFTELTY